MIWKAMLVALFAFAVALVVIAMERPSGKPQQQNYSQSGQQNTQTDSSQNSVTKFSWDAFWRKVWAEPINVFTLVLATATTILVIAGFFQGWILIKANQTATETAKAAKDSADTAHEALVKAQRAFIRVTAFPWLWRPDTDRSGKYFYDITPIIENAGDTPTYEMTIIRNYALRDTPLPDDFDFPYRDGAKPSLIGPHQTIGAANVTILDDDLLAVQKGAKYFYIWGTISYRDIFSGTPLHTTEFCTQISRVMGNPLDPRDPNLPKGTSLEIYFGIYQKHNRAD